MELEISKYEGAGNDFLLVDMRAAGLELTPAFVAALCDRRRGVGADGMMALYGDNRVDCRMEFFNSDGSRAAMCGNGSRCFALFACHVGAAAERMSFMADDGVHDVEITQHDADRADVLLTMRDVERVEQVDEGWFLDTGVPHLVVPVDDLGNEGLMAEGRRLRSSFRSGQGGTNVDFALLSADGGISIRTYERGVEGETFACGTGAVAAAIAADASMRIYSDIGCGVFGRFGEHSGAEASFCGIESMNGVNGCSVRTLGGALRVCFERRHDGSYGNVRLGGPARRICMARVKTENFRR